MFFVSLVKFSYWSKFHVNIITGSGVMTIFFYKGLTWNPEIGNTHVWVLPKIWRLGQVRDTKLGMNVSHKMLLNAAKYQGYSFYRFGIIKGKPTGGVKLPPTPTPRLGLNSVLSFHKSFLFQKPNICEFSCILTGSHPSTFPLFKILRQLWAFVVNTNFSNIKSSPSQRLI